MGPLELLSVVPCVGENDIAGIMGIAGVAGVAGVEDNVVGVSLLIILPLLPKPW